MTTVLLEKSNGIAKLILDKPPLNVLDIAMMEELDAARKSLAEWLASLAALRGKAKIAAAVGAVVAIVLLKTFDAKFWGVVVMGAALVILFFLPWLDNAPPKSIRYRPKWHKALYAIFVVFFVVLGYLGIQPPSELGTLVAQVGTLFYFAFFLLMPWWSTIGTFRPVPDRVTYQPH